MIILKMDSFDPSLSYCLLKSRWIPDSPDDAFLPFAQHLVFVFKDDHFTLESFSREFLSYYGFSIPLHLLESVLAKLVQKGFLNRRKNSLFVIADKEEDFPDFSEEATLFQQSYNSLVQEFIDFCKPTVITYDAARQCFSDFCMRYEIDSSTYSSNSELTGTLSGINFRLADFISKLKTQDSKSFSFLVDLCEAHLIKNYICQSIPSSSCENKTIYLDTPILLRLLGYEGDFFKSEYERLIRILLSHNNTFFIFQNTFAELQAVLRDAEYALSHSLTCSLAPSHVTGYFFENEFSSGDVEIEINNLEQNLNSCNVFIDKAGIDWNANTKYVEIEPAIKKAIINQYTKGGLNDQSFSETALDCDVKTVTEIYIKRNNNAVLRFKDLGVFFLTTNTGLFKAIRCFNSERHPGTFSPIVHDSFLGMLVSAENITVADQLMEDKVLSFCFSAHRPSKQALEIFMGYLDKFHKEGKISTEDFLVAKTGAMYTDALTNATLNEPDLINDDTPLDVLANSKKHLVAEVAKAASERHEMDEREKQEITKKGEDNLQKQRNAYEQKEKEDQLAFYRFRLSQANKEFRMRHYALWIPLFIFFLLCLISSLVALIFSCMDVSPFLSQYQWPYVLSLIVSAIPTLWSGLETFSNLPLIKRIDSSLKTKIAQKYDVTQTELTIKKENKVKKKE